jgi:hypothetical protein
MLIPLSCPPDATRVSVHYCAGDATAAAQSGRVKDSTHTRLTRRREVTWRPGGPGAFCRPQQVSGMISDR